MAKQKTDEELYHLIADVICDPLSENQAHPAFMKNQDKTRNRYMDI